MARLVKAVEDSLHPGEKPDSALPRFKKHLRISGFKNPACLVHIWIRVPHSPACLPAPSLKREQGHPEYRPLRPELLYLPRSCAS